MKVAILSESPADEAGVRILVTALMGTDASLVPMPPIRARPGWPGILGLIRSVVGHLQYRTDADALVLVVDSNSTPVYAAPPPSGADASRCRLRLLRQAVGDAIVGCRPPPGRSRLRTAVGIAVPAIEAWYLCGIASEVSENAWLAGLGRPSLPYTKASLKQKVYGTDRPSLRLETEKATEHAERVAANLALLEERFPIGFGALARDVRGWSAE